MTVLGVEGREAERARAVASVQAQVGIDLSGVRFLVDVAPATWSRAEVCRRRNALLARVRTRWVATLDDDDWWLPWHVQMLWRRLAAFSGSAAIIPRGVCHGGRDGEPYFTLSSALIDTVALRSIGGWIHAPGCHVDYITAYVLSASYPVHHIRDRATWVHEVGGHRQMVGASRRQELAL